MDDFNTKNDTNLVILLPTKLEQMHAIEVLTELKSANQNV